MRKDKMLTNANLVYLLIAVYAYQNYCRCICVKFSKFARIYSLFMRDKSIILTRLAQSCADKFKYIVDERSIEMFDIIRL